jgi:hypothetical protein
VAGVAYAKGASDMIAATQPLALDTTVAFFLGGTLIIVVLLCYEMYIWKKMR